MVVVDDKGTTIIMFLLIIFSKSESAMFDTSYMFGKLCYYHSINITSSDYASALECAVSCSEKSGCGILQFCVSETIRNCALLNSYAPQNDSSCLNSTSPTTWMCKYYAKIQSPTNVTLTTAITTSPSTQTSVTESYGQSTPHNETINTTDQSQAPTVASSTINANTATTLRSSSTQDSSSEDD
ncbi:uncharacterized protein LOC117344007 [Pecten maximus]|uniref:uncharacterized protein LOC117344007 n=1 Tax=Pecten maximus TaxID=6579 RepID=UPI0014580A22|nr:uncharacterized protein LOC117344007 [Pecten maximus]